MTSHETKPEQGRAAGQEPAVIIELCIASLADTHEGVITKAGSARLCRAVKDVRLDHAALLAENARLRAALVNARGMLHTVNECGSHECVDCREWAGIKMRECDAALAETGERAS